MCSGVSWPVLAADDGALRNGGDNLGCLNLRPVNLSFGRTLLGIDA